MEPRQHKLGIVTGEKGSGKSNTTLGTILDINRGNISIGLPPRNVLIIDVNNEYGEFKHFSNHYKPVTGFDFQTYKIKAIGVKHMGWMSEHKVAMVRRLVMLREDGTKMSIEELQDHLYYVLQTFGNGVLMIEDINKYTTHSFSNEMIGAIISHRHSNVDAIIQYQSIGKVNPTLWQNMNWLRMHRDGDSARRIMARIPEIHQYIQLAQEIINKKFREGEKRTFVYYNKDEMVVKGLFDEDEAREAVMKVISINQSQLLKPLVEQMDLKGNKIYTKEEAILQLMNQYMEENMRPLLRTQKQEQEAIAAMKKAELKMAAEKGGKV